MIKWLCTLVILSACSNLALENFNLKPFSLNNEQQNLALKAFEDRQYQQAAKLYNELFIKTNNNEYLFKAAESHRLMGATIQAKKLYEQLINQANISTAKRLDAEEGKALCLIQELNNQEAIILLNKIINEDASRWRTINAIAVDFALNQAYKEAFDYYNLALDLSNKPYLILNNMGLSYALEGKPLAAINCLEKALQNIEPTNPNKERIEFNLALIYASSGQIEKSEEICKKYLNDEQLQQNLEFYKTLAKNGNLAKQYFGKALKEK